MTVWLCVVFLCCWSVARAGDLSPDCEKGPSHWCRDLATASECGQVEYCHDNAWKDPAKVCMETDTCGNGADTTPKVEGILCIVCELVMKELESMLITNATEAEIEAALEKVCSLLPSTLKAECTSFIATYGPQIIKLLLQGASPSVVCTVLGLCFQSSTAVVVDTQPKVEGILCIVCELVMKELESMLITNATEAEIEAALEKVCSLLPSTLKAECTSFIATYGPQIIKLLLQGASPSVVCTVLGLCFQSSTAVVVDTKPKVEVQGLLCLVCELAMKELDSLILNNATEAEIEAALEKVCSILPSTLKQDCDNFVATYGPDIVKLIVEGTSPKLVCTLIGVCIQSHAEAFSDCDICKVVVNIVDAYLGDNATEPEVAKVLETVCDILPITIKTECVVFVGNYTEELVSLLLQDLQPEEVCQKLKLCTSFKALLYKID